LSNSKNTPIPYASIINTTSYKAGTTTDKKGEFNLILPKNSTNHIILFSSIGYKDTTLTVRELQENSKPIYLKEDVRVLEEVVITKSEFKEVDIGAPFGEIQSAQPGWSTSPGIMFGSFMKTNVSRGGIIKSLSLCISEQGYPTAPFTIRLLEPQQKVKPNKMEPLSEFSDLLLEPIKVQAKKSGWLEIDLSKYEIGLPMNGIYVIVIPLDLGPQYKWTNKSGEPRYGVSIPAYKNHQKSIYYSFIHNGTHLSYSNLAFSKLIPLAMALTYIKEK